MYFVLRTDFPLNDGGLFYVMIKDLQANQFRLPFFTSYNALNIPFAYSPLAFYVAGMLNNWFNISLLDVLHYLPVVLATLAIPVFFLLAREILEDRDQAIVAVAVYIIILPSFEWLIMGGSLTRSFGYLFSLGCLFVAAKSFRTGQARYAIWAGLLLGLTALSHQEIAFVTVASILVFYSFKSRNLPGLRFMLLEWGIATVVVAPYLLAVTGRHGIQPFVGAMFAGEFEASRVIAKLLSMSYTGEMNYTPIAFLILIGLWGCLAQRKYLLPVWLLVITLLNPRSVERTASAAAAMLAGFGLYAIILPGLARLAEPVHSHKDAVDRGIPAATGDAKQGWGTWMGVGILFVLFFQSALLVFLSSQENIRLKGLSDSERQAMAWVEAHTPEDGQFLVISNDTNWASDRVAEWFPALAERVSVNTAQGQEWLPGRAFARMRAGYTALKNCLFEDVLCLESWSEKQGIPFSHVYLSKSDSELQCEKPCTLPIQISIRQSSAYRLIFENPAAVVFEKTETIRSVHYVEEQ